MDYTYIISYLKECKTIMADNRDYLIKLDSAAGDGDLGLTMGDGFAAAWSAAAEMTETDIGKILYQGGKAMSTAVPSTMGTLMASGLMQAGKAFRGKDVLNETELVDLFQAYFDGVQMRGQAKVGEKTFLDGLAPAIVALSTSLQNGENIKEASEKAANAAEEGFHNTASMIARHGRAAARGEASRSLEDPGAAVAMFLMRAFAQLNKR